MKYDPRLSQLRFFASFSVALYHLWTLQIIPLVIFRPGWLGVPLFFELSIYLLLNTLDDNPSLSRYFKRRVRRIWPLYFLAVMSVFLVDKYTFHLDVTYHDLLLHFLFISFILAPFSFQYLFWSLQLEELMYFVIPLIHAVNDRTKFIIGVTFILTSLFYSLFIVFLPYDEFHLLYFMPPYWLGAYGWGILAYLLQKKGYRPSSNNIHYIIIGILSTQYVFVSLYVKIESVYEFFTRFVIYNLVLPFFALLILKPPNVINKVTMFLGEVGYGVYLWTLLFQELFGVLGILYGVSVAILTEFPLRRKEIVRRLRSLR